MRNMIIPRKTSILRHPGWATRGSRSSRCTRSTTRTGSVLWGTVLETEPGRRSAVLTRLPGPVPHHLGVDRAGNAVVKLGIQLGQLVTGVDAGLGDVTDSGSLHNIPDHELTDGLVLGTTLSTVGTPPM